MRRTRSLLREVMIVYPHAEIRCVVAVAAKKHIGIDFTRIYSGPDEADIDVQPNMVRWHPRIEATTQLDTDPSNEAS